MRHDQWTKSAKKGFTLIEILIVLVIVGVLAALAIPVYQSTIEKSRKQEAYQTLAAVRESQLRYRSGSSSFATTYNQLDFDPTNTALDPPGMNRHFTYGAPASVTTSTWNVTATRNTVDGGSTTNTVRIDQIGKIDSNY